MDVVLADFYTKYPYPLSAIRLMGDTTHITPYLVQNPKNIAVLGCGTQEANVVAHTYPNAWVWGVDLSPASLAISKSIKRRYRQNIAYTCGDFLDHLQIPHKFDLVIASGVIHHLPDIPTALVGIQSLLTPKGIFAGMVYEETGREHIPETVHHFLKLGWTPKDIRDACRTHDSRISDEVFDWVMRHRDCDVELADTWLHPRFCQYSQTTWKSIFQKAFSCVHVVSDSQNSSGKLFFLCGNSNLRLRLTTVP